MPTRWLIAATVVVVALTTFATRPLAAPAAASDRWLATDGLAVVATIEGGGSVTSETARLDGLQAMIPGPMPFMMTGLSADEVVAKTWVRVTDHTADGAGQVVRQRDRLLEASDAGVLLYSIVDGGTSFTNFKPARLELPADVRDGSTWTWEGNAFDGEGKDIAAVRTLRAESKATRASDAALAGQGCLDVTTTQSGEEPDEPARTTWCPGRGVVASAVGDEPPTRPGAPALPTVSADAAFGPLPEGMTLEPIDRTAMSLLTPPALPPAQLSRNRGVLVPTGRADLFGYSVDAATLVPGWRAHPGGRIVTMAGFGDLVVAVTTQRRLVAYSGDGLRLWTADLPDVAELRPLAMGGDTVVVALLDGTIAAFRASDGRPRWTRRPGDLVTVAPSVGGDLLAVADASGTVHALAPDGTTRWTADGFARIGSVLVTPGAVVVATQDPWITGLSPVDGSVLWRTRLVRDGDELARLGGDVVVLRTPQGAVGLDPASGTARWVATGSVEAHAEADGGLVVVGDGHVRTLRVGGTTTGSWALPVSGAASVWVHVNDQGFVVSDSTGKQFVGRRP